MGLARPLAFMPADHYPAISVTGAWCGLQCLYCRARYLKGMIPCTTWRDAARLLPWLETRAGVLVSGGFDAQGRLPIPPWLPRLLERLKRGGAVVSMHALNPDARLEDLVARRLVDHVDLEFPVSRKQLELMNIDDAAPTDTARILEEMGASYSPHLLIGLPGVDVAEELAAVEELTSYRFEVAVFIVFMPTPGTPLAREPPPDPGRVVRVLEYASGRLGAEVAVGCMRPPSIRRSLDQVLVSTSLVDRIANPHTGASTLSSPYRVLHVCCSLPRRFLTGAPRSRRGRRRAR